MRKFRAFTLIELLIVVVIIGILATFVVISLNGAQKRARNTKAINAVSEVKGSLETYYSLSNSFDTLTGAPAGNGCNVVAGVAKVAFNCSAALQAVGATGFTTNPKDAKDNSVQFVINNASSGYFAVQGKSANWTSDKEECWFYEKTISGVTQNLDKTKPADQLSSGGDTCPF